jgi:hypothetical protein
MAKTDSFFVRAQLDFNGTTYAQTSIDLGAYVDALGKSVMRIHNISVAYGDPNTVPAVNASANQVVSFQLTTQSQGALVNTNDKSVISAGKLAISADATGATCLMSESLDVAPQYWTNGYLVGVEQIYLGVNQTFNAFTAGGVSIVLECTVETLSSSAAMALALSQQ